MPVACDQDEVVLQGERGDPKVVVRDGSGRAFELNEKARVVLGCFAAGEQNCDRRFGEQLL